MKRALVLLLVLGCSKQPARAPEAWGVADYAKAGIAIDKPWAPDDYPAAAAVLKQLLPDHRDRLPRFHGDKSGAVFAKLMTPPPDDSAAPIAARFFAHMTRGEALQTLSKLYSAVPPSRELIEVMGANLGEAAALATEAEPFLASFGPDDPQRAIRLDGLAKMRTGFGEMMAGGLMIASDPSLPEDDRVAMVNHVTAVLHVLLPFTEPATQQQIRSTIAAQVSATKGNVHDAFVAAQRALP